MEISVWPSSERGWHAQRAVIVRADELGWNGAWVADHFMPSADVDDSAGRSGPYLEAWSALAALAALTSRVRLGTLVSSVTYRHPAVLAAMAGTVDEIASSAGRLGRVVLGIGAGWQENEHAAYGLALGTARDRSDRLVEAGEILRSLLRNDRTTYEGSYFRLHDAPNEPRPSEPIPLLIAGKGERRTIPTAAALADEWNAWASVEQFTHKRELLHRHAEHAGRDPRSIRCSTQALVVFDGASASASEVAARLPGRPIVSGSDAEIVDHLVRYHGAGVDEFIVPDWHWDDDTERAESYDRFFELTKPMRLP